ncbi:MAG TPA: hypothetical protein VGB94_02015 [Acidobacteriaceae bacterium]
MRDIVCNRSAAEVFGGKAYAAVLLTGIPVAVLAGYVLNKQALKIDGYFYCLLEALVPSMLLIWIFAGWRLISPDSMPPILQPSSGHIVRARCLGWVCICAGAAGIILPSMVLRYRMPQFQPHLGFQNLPNVLLTFFIPAFLSVAYAGLRIPNQGIAFYSAKGKFRTRSLAVLGTVAVGAGIFTVYTWGSLWDIPILIMGLICGRLFMAELRQQAYQPPEDPEANNGRGVLQPVSGDGGPRHDLSAYGFERKNS